MTPPVKSIVIALATICLAAVALADPAKPNPSSSYTLSAFGFTSNGYVTARTYYDQANKRGRTDSLDADFNLVGEFIGSWETNKGYWYDSASGNCQSFALNQPWLNAWDFLNTATYSQYDEHSKCDLWLTDLGNDMTLASCFSGNSLTYLGTFNGTEMVTLYFITKFVPSVDPSVFSLPSTCSSTSFTLANSLPMMNLKKFKVPAHPLLF